jgi:hypothetical protein
MAIVKNPLFRLSGKIGGIVYRQCGNKTVAARAPRFYNHSKSPETIAREKRFRLAAQVSGAIYSDNILKQIWQKEHPGVRNICNKITQFIYGLLDSGNPVEINSLIPGGGLEVICSFEKSEGKEKLIGWELGKKIWKIKPKVEKYLAMAGIIVLSKPINSRDKATEVIRLRPNMVQMAQMNEPRILTDLYDPCYGDSDNYEERKVYFIMATLDKDGKVVKYSNTMSVVL